MVVVADDDRRVNHGGTTSKNGQASHCHRCWAPIEAEVYDVGVPQRRLGVTSVS